MKKLLLSLSLAVAAMFAASADTFVKVTDASTLKAGDEIIIVAPTKNVAMAAQNSGNYRESTSVTISNNQIEITDKSVAVVTLEASGNNWALKTAEGYLNAGTKNKVTSVESITSLSIAIDGNGNATIADLTTTNRKMQYNGSNPRFAFYESNQTAVSIFRKFVEESDEPIEYTELPESFNIAFGQTKALASSFPETIEFASDDETIATVDENGLVTGVNPGKTSILAMWDADEKYTEGYAEIEIEVIYAATFDFITKYEDYGLEIISGTAPTPEEPVVIKENDVTLEISGQQGLYKQPEYRIYSGTSLAFTAPSGYNLIKIEANCSLSSLKYEGEALNQNAWEGSAAFVELEAVGKTTLTKITVYLEKIGGAGDDPVVDPLDYDIVILDAEGETLSGVIGSHDFDSVESFKIFFSQTNAEGISFYYMLEANTEEPEVETQAAEPAEGYTLYNHEDGIVIPNNYNGTLSYYAQDDVTEAKTDIKTIAIDPNQNTSGISAVEIDAANGAVEYFNLQGVRVNAPAAGLYLMRQGDKVMKVVIR
ncbi:MAG: Ig-like domain-containing protein [Muribaculaceae bacterium]|nr:Ig-like domain-containing protein [Muribaculaceae bacterium]MDE5968853.1 Ig-like domain-containing protein [Muribaculaceae bacterium]